MIARKLLIGCGLLAALGCGALGCDDLEEVNISLPAISIGGGYGPGYGHSYPSHGYEVVYEDSYWFWDDWGW
ncbi:MAG: hypothetical protein HRU75_11860 [Planctomycetia bacterium]|nr:MAG: hypothetical protein HRU75_11860 [Planctomycetia bacterium]